MTITPETCMCECEECLALRAAEDDPGSGETVAVFEHDGSTYEIDHLGTVPAASGASSRCTATARRWLSSRSPGRYCDPGRARRDCQSVPMSWSASPSRR